MKLSAVVSVCTAAVLAGTVLAAAPAQAAGAENAGTYYNATPGRIADSRYGTGGMPKARLVTGSSVSIPVLGRSGVPATGVSAVVVNLTAIKTSTSGWVTAYASRTAKPNTSSLNFGANWTGATTSTVDVGADGRIKLDVTGSLDLAVDIIGYYGSASGTGAAGASFVPMDGMRMVDTRETVALRPGQSVRVSLGDWDTTDGMVPRAVRTNVTALSSSASGWLATWSGVGAAPATSTVNVVKAEVSPNSTVVALSKDSAGEYGFTVKNTSNTTMHALVDIEGMYVTSTDGPFSVRIPTGPSRIIDTRYGVGAPKAKVAAGRTIRQAAPQLDWIFPLGFEGTITGAAPLGTTWLTAWGGGPYRPTTSSLNLVKGVNRANGMTLSYGMQTEDSDPGFAIYNAAAATDVIVDRTAYFGLTFDLPAFAAKQKAAEQVVARAAARPTR